MTRTAAVLEAVAAQVTEWTHELDGVHDKLHSFGQAFLPAYSALDQSASGPALPGQTDLLPPDTDSLLDAAKKLVRRLLPKIGGDFEEAFQKDMIDPSGGIWAFIRA